MAWVFHRKYWKRNTDIFNKDTKDYLETKEGYKKGIRNYYTINSKETLMRKIYKDYLNIALDKVTKGNIVVLGPKSVTLKIKTKEYKKSPYNDVLEEIRAKGQIPYVYLNTGEIIKKNRDFLVIPSKNIREKLLALLAEGKPFTKIKNKYFKL